MVGSRFFTLKIIDIRIIDSIKIVDSISIASYNSIKTAYFYGRNQYKWLNDFK